MQRQNLNYFNQTVEYYFEQIDEFVKDLEGNKFQNSVIFIKLINPYMSKENWLNVLNEKINVLISSLSSKKFNDSTINIDLTHSNSSFSKGLTLSLMPHITKATSARGVKIELGICDKSAVETILQSINTPNRPALHLSLRSSDLFAEGTLLKGICSYPHKKPLTISASHTMGLSPSDALLQQCNIINLQIEKSELIEEALCLCDQGQLNEALHIAKEAQKNGLPFVIWELAANCRNEDTQRDILLEISPDNMYFPRAKEILTRYVNDTWAYRETFSVSQIQKLLKPALRCGLQEIVDDLFHRLCAPNPNEPMTRKICADYETLINLSTLLRHKNQQLRREAIHSTRPGKRKEREECNDSDSDQENAHKKNRAPSFSHFFPGAPEEPSSTKSNPYLATPSLMTKW